MTDGTTERRTLTYRAADKQSAVRSWHIDHPMWSDRGWQLVTALWHATPATPWIVILLIIPTLGLSMVLWNQTGGRGRLEVTDEHTGAPIWWSPLSPPIPIKTHYAPTRPPPADAPTASLTAPE